MRKFFMGLLFASMIVAIAACSGDVTSTGSSSSTTSASQPTAAPTKALVWKTVSTFSGNGAKKTAIFTAPDDWKILYSCASQAVGDGTYVDGVLTVTVTGTDNLPVDVAVNATCKAGAALTKGETEEHQGGQVYLDINGTGDWSLQVQELK